MDSTTLAELARLVTDFRDARDWRQFHSLRNLLVSLNLEAAELLELAQWRSDEEIEAMAADPVQRDALCDELGDVFAYLLLIADRAGVDLAAALRTKMAKNELKYPVHLARGSREKYDRLKATGRDTSGDTE